MTADLLEVELGPRVPAAALRALLVLVASAIALTAVHGPLLVLGLVLALGAAVRPAAAWAVVGLAVLADLVQPAGVGVALPLLVAAVHAVAVLTGLVPAVPWRATVELAALGSTSRRYVLVEVPAQVLAGAVLVSTGRLPVAPAAALAGGVLLLGAVLVAVPRLAADR